MTAFSYALAEWREWREARPHTGLLVASLVLAVSASLLWLGPFALSLALPAVALAWVADRLGSRAAAHALLQGLQGWERLGDWPTRFWTGYFLVVRARRRGTAAPPPA